MSASSEYAGAPAVFRNMPEIESEENFMGQLLTTLDPVCRLTFEGKMTFDVALALEGKIIDAMRRFRRMEVDLSGVSEIDLCGIHLLGLLQNVGGKAVVIVATSQVVEQAARRQLASFHGASLARTARREWALSNS